MSGITARPLLALAAVATLGFVSACSASSDAQTSSPAPLSSYRVDLPGQLLGLNVEIENIQENLSGIEQTYLQGLGLYSFREGNELLRATLQVGRFNELAEQQRQRFRDSIIGQLGASAPIELRVGSRPVYLSAGSDQNIFTWFDDKGFYVLSIRSDYPFPRTMMRKLVELELLP